MAQTRPAKLKVKKYYDSVFKITKINFDNFSA